MANPNLLSVADLRGGINTTDSPIALLLTEATDARNIDWSVGMLGGKRRGTAEISLTGSVFVRRVPVLGASSNSATLGGTPSSLAWAHGAVSSSSAASRVLLVTFLVRESPATPRTITSVTYGVTALSLLGSVAINATDYLVRYAYTDTTTVLTVGQTITITMSGTVAGLSAVAETYLDCAMVAQNGATNFGTSTGTTAAVNYPLVKRTLTYAGATEPTPLDGYVIASGFTYNSNEGGYAGPGQTLTGFSGGVPVSCSSQLVRRGVSSGESAISQWVLEDSVAAAYDYAIGQTLLRGIAVTAADQVSIVSLIRHTPTDDVTLDELFAIDNFGRIDRYVSGAWQAGVPHHNSWIGVSDATPDYYYINGTSLHGKLFLTARPNRSRFDRSATATDTGDTLDNRQIFVPDRLMVWDGTSLRFAGLDVPGTPTAANTAVGGAYASARAFRIRWVERNSQSVVVRRGEPSAVVAITPSGANDGVTITKEAVRTFGFAAGGLTLTTGKPREGETHWEVEESVNYNATTGAGDFYRIATVAVATTTYTDRLTVAQVTADPTLLSASAGEYVPLRSARHVVVDDDRIMIGGTKWTNPVTGLIPTTDSTVSWTPVDGDDGVGNDERVDATVSSFIGLDGMAGGNIRGIVAGEHGVVYVKKRTRSYRLVRTGQSATGSAYDSIAESRTYGALMNCVTTGFDAVGNVCIYAVDPTVGLYRHGTSGIEILMDKKVRATWKLRNKTAEPYRLLSYQDLGQVWVFVAMNSATAPDLLFAYDRRTSGFALHNGNLATILSAVNFPDSTGELRPTLGSSRVHALQRADTGTDDDGTYFRGYVTTKPFLLGDLFSKFVIGPAVLHAKVGSGVTINLRTIRDYGLETADFTALLTAAGSETYVTKVLDDLVMSECFAVQLELGDPPSYTGSQLAQTWTLDGLAIKLDLQESAG